MHNEHSQANGQISRMTPMLQQYFSLKETAPHDAILFFRMGDFYEIFGEDAKIASKKLNIVLTSRERGDQEKIPFCGVPHHSAEAYFGRLVREGFKVAVAEQMEDPSLAKGLVRREIVRVLTPGTFDDAELGSKYSFGLCALLEDPVQRKWAVVFCDPNLAELRLVQADDLLAAFDFINKFNPQELVLRKFQEALIQKDLEFYKRAHGNLSIAYFAESVLRDDFFQQKILEKHQIQIPAWTEKIPSGLTCLAGLISYLESLKLNCQSFKTVLPLIDQDYLDLSHHTIRDLEIFETYRDRKKAGSLFGFLDQHQTPMGSRALKWRLLKPAKDAKIIAERHEALQLFYNLGALDLERFKQYLSGVCDLEKLAVKVLNQNITPKDLIKLRMSLRQTAALWGYLSNYQEMVDFFQSQFFEEVSALSSGLEKTLVLLDTCFREELGILGEGNEIFQRGFDSKLDEYNLLNQNSNEAIEAYEDQIKKQTTISSLKIKEHKTFGLLFEVTRSNLDKVPSHFIRKQTMVNGERFVTQELIELFEKLSQAKELAIAREEELFLELKSRLAKYESVFKSIGILLGQIDFFCTQSWIALKSNFVKPILGDGIRLQKSRHPMVEVFIGQQNFCANDLIFIPPQKQCLITGPNMAGKSTIMRQVALSAIMCQSGLFVPARSAMLPVFDQVYTRVGAADDLSQGLSTFMVEMTESATILNQATKNSLVILDEVGRGTSTSDGLALAQSIFEYLIEHIGAWTFFATHYHELVNVFAQNGSVKMGRTQVLESSAGITFTHVFEEGSSSSSYGIEVAKLAGVPRSVIERAQKLVESTGMPSI